MVPVYIYSVSVAVCFSVLKEEKNDSLLFKSVLRAVFWNIFAYRMCGIGYFRFAL